MYFLKIIFIDTIKDVLYFPIWWYSQGLILTFRWMAGEIIATEKMIGVGIWIKNIFVPMFGQRDIQGRVVSFFMRVFQILFRFIALLGFSVFYIVIFLFYIILPLIILIGVFLHLPSVLSK